MPCASNCFAVHWKILRSARRRSCTWEGVVVKIMVEESNCFFGDKFEPVSCRVSSRFRLGNLDSIFYSSGGRVLWAE